MVSTTVDKYVYLSLERSFNPIATSLKYSTVEKVDSVDEIKHPIFRECLKMHNVQGVEINSTADIPSGTGMGSSSSFTVGLINLLRAYNGNFSDRRFLAESACEMEIDILHEPIGKQDQYAAAYGGLNYYHFKKDHSVEVEHLALSKELKDTLNKRLVLFYIGGDRSASTILKEQSESDERKDEATKKLCSLAIKLKDDLKSGDIDSLGKLLDESWKLKREITSRISNNKIDEIYDLGLSNGAVGGKLLGAGGAGFMLFYAHEEDQTGLKAALSRCRDIPFRMECEGSKVVFNDQH
ncbi:GHMP family kinase ATP-binding protein [Candidatus Methanoplasma termitum]|uniref:GHMP family kinase ATP-binding protein n=1 Tax=Candidatus Methanoplasma termitum TaxID=1577791 RepID=UPI000B278C05|nr:hypothetical protein [Candidatus Methanoplasma termitum]